MAQGDRVRRTAVPFVCLFATILAGTIPTGRAADRFTTEKAQVDVETVVSGLDHPWGLAFLPDGAMLVSERSGVLRLVRDNRLLANPVSGVPKVRASGQGGLLDVAVDPNFKTNRQVFLSYAEPGPGGAGTAVARARLASQGDNPRLEDLQVIFRVTRKSSGGRHFGSRLVFSADGNLFVTLGERGDAERAQDPFDTAGSVVRVGLDGSIPSDNPFADGQRGGREIWSTGHRNPQGAGINPTTGQLWIAEHGAAGGDEINIPLAGRNYGWPVISYGLHYRGGKIGVGTKAPGMEQPAYYWDPSIAPSGLAFYNSNLFAGWKGNLFIGSLKFKLLVRLELDGNKVVHEERLLKDRYGRIRDVRAGPDGAIWVLTDQSDGKLLRLTPAKAN